MTEFRPLDWRAQDRMSRTSLAKRVLYDLARPLLARRARGWLDPSTLTLLDVHNVIGARGIPLEFRRRWATRGMNVKGARLLIQGTGTGWDVLSWAELGPRSIVATDLFEFPDSWEEIARWCRDRYGVPVEFRAAPLESHAFLESGSIDLCGSDAVLEHCRDLDAVMDEARRVLRPAGCLYAGYGPLWWSAGGDHFSGRGGLSEVFNHVALSADEYRRYFERFIRPHEDFQSGGRYVELDLFSRLTSIEYLECFKRHGFSVEDAWLQVSEKALAFRAAFGERWRGLCRTLPAHVRPDDLLIAGHLVRLRPRVS